MKHAQEGIYFVCHSTNILHGKGKDLISDMMGDVLLQCPVTRDSGRYFKRKMGRKREKMHPEHLAMPH